MKVKEIMTRLEAKYSNEKEYLQAVRGVLSTIEEIYNNIPNLKRHVSLSDW